MYVFIWSEVDRITNEMIGESPQEHPQSNDGKPFIRAYRSPATRYSL